MTAQRWRRGALVVLLLASSLSCSETDEQLVDNIGVTVLLLVDSGLSSQIVSTVEERHQVAEWDVISEDATLGKTQFDIDGALIDPLFGEDCNYADTVNIAGSAGGPCSAGVVIESSTDPFDLRLTVVVEKMQMRRAETDSMPESLPDHPDYDLRDEEPDGVPNATDNCPFASNPSQAPSELPGIGEKCVVPDFFLGTALDSDGDNFADYLDNCLWISNPGQEDTEGLGAQGIDDGIGDACIERTVDVIPDVGVGDMFVIEEELELLQGFETVYVVVDFSTDETLQDCDETTYQCTLDVGGVKVCTAATLTVAALGCP